jgi:copper(I)-binding protein
MIITKKLPLKRGDNLKIQKVLSSEKIQNVDLNVQAKNVLS